MRKWHVMIPVRPKAVQSVRMARGAFYADRKTRQWKQAVEPFVRAAASGEPPSKLPIAVTACRYIFRLPKNAKKAVRDLVASGGFVPYLGAGDLSDNLNKGLIDVCKGILFEDDAAIVRMSGLEKRYGLEDMIELELEEVPGLMAVDGLVL